MYNYNSIIYFINKIEYNNLLFEHYILEKENERKKIHRKKKIQRKTEMEIGKLNKKKN